MSGFRIYEVGPSATVGAATVERLERRGHEVTVETARRAAEAIDGLQNTTVDCLVCPAELPDTDGLAFLERVHRGFPAVPTVLVTDPSNGDALDDAIEAGVTACVRRLDGEYHAVLAKRIHDAVERARTERELQEERRFVDQLFDQVPVSLYVKDEQARHVRLSRFYDTDPAVAEGKTDRELYPYIGEESYRDDMRVIQSGEPMLNEVEHFIEDGAWNMTSKVPWYGEDGEIKGLIGVTWQITEQKEAERELQKHNERLEEFARIVSHELRNPLQVARGRTELLRESGDSEHPDEILDALDRIGSLVDDLLALAHGYQRVDEKAWLSLGDAATKCWQAAEFDAATLDIETDATIRANRAHLEHLLENLFENAVEYGGDGVTVTVGPTAGGFYVADDGPGIPDEERDEVFEVGYSSSDERIGYGLPIVAEVVAAHEWDIEITDSADGGTRFDITGVTFDE
ncbi:MAG: ATP-binding protein [Haloarculaceae archaeon]